MRMQDIWTLEKHCIWSGIVYSDMENMETFTSGEQEEQVQIT